MSPLKLNYYASIIKKRKNITEWDKIASGLDYTGADWLRLCCCHICRR